MVPGWASLYVGIPYRLHGSTREGLDCWGLVRLVQMEVFGRRLPPFEKWRKIGEYERAAPWIQVEATEDGDIAHLRGVHRNRFHDFHCGVWCGRNHILHAEEGTGVVLERADSPQMRWRIIKTVRPCLETT